MRPAFKMCVVTLACAVAVQAQDKAPEGFASLFNGKNLNGWKVTGKATKWGVDDGVIACKGGIGGGYLRTPQEYGDFEFRFEYRWEKGGGNSGVAIRTPDGGAPSSDGMEIQLIDDEGLRGKLNDTQHTGAIYDLLPAKEGTNKKIGEWNSMRIVAKGRRIIVEQNEKLLVNANLNDYESKFEKHPGLKREKGFIGFQSHTGRIEFRNVFIKELLKGRDTDIANRIAIPGDVAVAKAEAAIRQVLKDDYAKKSAADLKLLSQKLLKLAEETRNDPVSRYVMLRDARDIARDAADPTLTLQAIDALSSAYQIDRAGQQLAALEKILASNSVLTTAKIIAETAIESAQSAAEADELDDVVEFSQLALNAMKKGRFTASAIDDAEANLALAKKSRDAFATIRPAFEKLKTAPTDAAANTTVGKYRSFVQHRWDEGLKHLSKADDDALKAVAELDLKAPRTGVIEDSKLADAWWDYAQTAPADVQWAALVRARHWYGRTIPGLTGLPKARAEGRLAITAGGTEYRPGLLCEFTAKLPAVLKGKKARLDTTIDFSGGEFADTKQTDLTVKWTGALAPPRAGRYTLVVQATDPVRVRVDGKVLIDTTGAGSPRKEAAVTLGERATPLIVEFFSPNTDKHKIKLAWITPGNTTDEPIPAECLFHDRKTEAVLGK